MPNPTFEPINFGEISAHPEKVVDHFRRIESYTNGLTQLLNSLVKNTNTATSPQQILNAVRQSGVTSATIVTDSGVRTVIKAIVAGTTYNEVFDAPSLLINTPVSEAWADGMMSGVLQIPNDGSITVRGFTIVPTQTGTLRYSYKHI